MKNSILQLRYLTSYLAVHDPYFCLEHRRQIEKSSLEYELRNVDVKMRDLGRCIMDCINKL